MLRHCLIALLLCCATSAPAQVFKCRGADGALAYSDKPCPVDAQQNILAVESSGGSMSSGTGGALQQRCDDPSFAPTLPSDRIAAQLARDELGRKLTPAHRWTLERMGYGLALSKADIGMEVDRDGSLHVCARGTTKGDLEIVVLSDGRAIEWNGRRWKYFGDSMLQLVQLGCDTRVRDCLTSVGRDLAYCLGTIPACGPNDKDCCPAECLREYSCRHRRGDTPFEAYYVTFQGGCPANPPIVDSCR